VTLPLRFKREKSAHKKIPARQELIQNRQDHEEMAKIGEILEITGKNSVRRRSTLLSRNTPQSSFRSAGMALAPAMTLNRMCHCVPSSKVAR
jgi:hypothetical protein